MSAKKVPHLSSDEMKSKGDQDEADRVRDRPLRICASIHTVQEFRIRTGQRADKASASTTVPLPAQCQPLLQEKSASRRRFLILKIPRDRAHVERRQQCVTAMHTARRHSGAYRVERGAAD